MREKLLRKLKQNKAFTLMEMMITVAIVVILLGISIVAINDWTQKLKMTELDSYAKTVYLEAQNQLASLETEGSLAKLYNDLSIEGGAYYDEYNGRKLVVAPTDYDETLYGSYYTRMYYFTSNDTIMTTFVPEVSMSDENGCYLIELNPESGDVYGVFYWEKDNTLFQGNVVDIYKSIQEMIVEEGDSNNRQLKSRTEYTIGYYGGIAAETTSATDYKLNQRVELINDEELFVKISYDYTGRMLNYLDGATEFDIEVSITGEESGSEWKTELDIAENDYVNLSTYRLETGLLLDGLGVGQDFRTITSGTGLIPGENLIIQVETTFKQGGIALKEKSNPYKVNSLFESTGKIDGLYTISLSKVRHLRNLSDVYYTWSEDGSVVVSQNNDIDFASGTYAFNADAKYVGEGETTRPVSAISPISNAAIFENTEAGRSVTVKGNNFVIKNLVVSAASGTENVGLFAKATNVNFEYIRLEDYTLNASGCSNVGALVGNISGGKIDHSGVYLLPYYKDVNGAKKYYNQETDSEYGTVMARHYGTFLVTGGTDVGGLVGESTSTAISHCYSAVQVKGNTNVGGLIGNANNQTITNSYASGDVKHLSASGSTIGGLLGRAVGITIKDAYATGDVYGGNTIGGFVGYATNGWYENCSSYGEVLNTSGTETFANGVKVGGFVSDIGNNGGSEVWYLKQIGHNASDDFSDIGLAYTYSRFTNSLGAGDVHSTAASFPYDGTLLYKAFPFKAVTDSHYGDWPLQYLINTSLVYYEKYANGSYGYYSVTSLTDTSETGDDTADDYVWVLDSLKDETCVEDGYALLSMYYLDSFRYSTYQFVDGTWKLNGTDKLTVVNQYSDDLVAASKQAVDLGQYGFLHFNAYEKDTTVNEYTVDYTGKPIKDSFTMSGMYLYQLPYEMQHTYRYGVQNFYDRIVIYDAYAKGNIKEEDAQSVIGGKTVEEGETYFYSPHFAKTAVNPGLSVESDAKLKDPETVAIRSARQLNALGTNPYYWNNKGWDGVEAEITYVQEVDINFSTYTNGTKKYCGHEFNLLAFDQDYSNKPIGQRDSDSSSYGAFQNNYNGNFFRIIDYCVKSNNQYVGLFGEIYKASGAKESQIQNVVMVVSNPKQEANYLTAATVKEQNNAGYIIGTYQEYSNAWGNNRQRTGVGALVGSDYTVGLTDGEASVFTIYNCASAGYKVQYHITSTSSGYQQPLGIAIGGMIGYSRGNVAQSSATNDVKLVAKDSVTGDTAAVMIGGFTGSAFFGTTLNCYAGGSIDVDDSNGTCYINRLRIGGFCPGWMYAPGIENESNEEDVRFQNIYSYTKVENRVWSVREKSGGNTFNHLMPTVSRMRLYYSGGKWNTEYENGSNAVRVPGFSYYLNSVITKELLDKNSSDARRYYEYQWSLFASRPKTCDPATYVQLSNFTWVNSNNGVKFISTSLYPTLVNAGQAVTYSSDLKGKNYPFPAFTYRLDANGQRVYVHYGDWPLQ